MEPNVPSPAPERVSASQIVRAGAGAGKTYALVEKTAEIARAFMAAHGRWPRVVATTFTRKATQELRERLMLKALSDAPDLVEFVNSRGHLTVSTIHGVLDSFLKRHGSEMGVDPGYRLASASEATRIARRVLRDALFEDPERAELLERHAFDRLTKLARRIDELRSRSPGARPATAADLESFARAEFERLARDLARAAESVRAEATKADWLAMADGFDELAAALRSRGAWEPTRDSAIAAAAKIKTARWSEKNPPVDEEINDFCKSLLKRARSLDDPDYDPAVWREFDSSFAAVEALALRFSERFRSEKLARGLIEISDLEAFAMECARRNPEAAAGFASEWDHWLIDEYQDTSPFQVELLRALTQTKPIYIVGDPQQSIYLFRGARSEVFAEKESEIEAGGGQRASLRRNYRSRPELLAFFNDFFATFDPPFAPMEPNMPDGSAHDPALVPAAFYAAPDEEAEWKALVRRAQDLLEAGARPDDVCVLARTNRDLASGAAWLNKFGLSTHVHSSSGFYDRRETLDAIGFLRFLANPHDDANAVELMRSPWFRAPDDALAEVACGPERRGGASLWAEVARRAGDGAEWEGARALRRALEIKREAGLVEAFRAGLIERGFVDFSHLHDMSGRRESNLWKLVAQLAQEEALPGFNPLAFVAGRLQDAKRADGSNEGDAVAALEPDRINLMTVHASKGLQFKHVLLPRMSQPAQLTTWEDFTFDERRQLWSFRVPMGEDLRPKGSLAESAWLEEFREQERLEHARVLYVALTRAKDSVYMSWIEPGRPHSWAHGLRWPVAEAGTFSRERYSYEVWPPQPREPSARARGGYEAAAPRARHQNSVPRLCDRWFARAESAGTDRAKSASVTALLERAVETKQVLSTPAGLARRIRAAQEGVAMHRLMELLQSQSSEQVALLAARWFPRRRDEALAAVEAVRAMREPPLLDLIRDGSAEWGFAFRQGESIVEGQIDLWGRADGQLWIVDYKSGGSDRRAQAFAQLSLYAIALRKAGAIANDERAQLAAVYPFSGEAFVEVEPELSATLSKFGLD